ncbi:MAG: AI-2E family transporter [Thermoleophilia bacterium]|nr:AI-2E family transporter [Thermoleophilia bacterium]
MSGRRAPQPAWAKLVAVAAVLVIVWILGQTIGPVLLVFTVSTVVALLLNPLVRFLRKLHIPRGLAVLLVFVGFIATVALAVFLVISPVRTQIEEIQANLPVYTDQAERQADDLQQFFDRRGIDVDVKARADAFLAGLQDRASEAADNVVDYSLDVLGVLVTLIFILVACIYMLLDAPRILRFAQRVGGPDTAVFLRRVERTLTEYVKAQLLVSLIIGTSAGIVLWIFGVTGLFPLGATFAVAFTAWVFVMEFIPYVGPILGAVPPVLLALFTSPLAALWVVVAFLAIHQLEGHIVVPKVMSSAVGVHPLVVIFGLLIGEHLAGIVGVLIAIPVVVVVKEAVIFASERLGFGTVAAGPAPAAAEAPGPVTREIPTRAIDAPGLRPER